MKRGNNPLVLCLFGILPVVWLGLLIAPAAGGGLPEILARFPASMNDPFHIELCGDSVKTVLVLFCVYGLSIGVFLSSRRNYRRGEEHGSAKWGNARAVNKKYRATKPEDNKIFTQNVRVGLDGRKHRRNLNTVVVGGSGAGKTRFYAKPNLCQANTSFVVLDPKGELLRDTGYLLKQKGYDVRVLDLLNMEKSHCYNPFVYLRDDNDVQRLVTNLFKSTTPKGSQSNDPFWDTAASMLLLALVFYLKYEAPPDEQNFPMVMEMLRAADVREDMDEYTSPLDELFERLEMRDPDHIAVKYYKDYHSGSAKTLKSIQITLAARLEKFNLSSLAALTATDELDLPSLGEKKVALFALIPDNDTSFNFLVSILYTQLFQQLFYLADHKYGGSLPVPVHFLMDEFSNVSLPDDFSKILAVMRSRQVFVSIILQNIAALKALFEKEWESILGNCDEFLYLGGNETSTHKLISESYLGKATIDTNTYGKSSGRNGNYSTNYQISGRELMTPDEVRMLDNRYALLFIRGELPVMDEKYDILKHPNVSLTTDGSAVPYEHGGTEHAVATLSLAGIPAEDIPYMEETEPDYELLSDEDIEALFSI
jgi:type IV secretion system protein VirD4